MKRRVGEGLKKLWCNEYNVQCQECRFRCDEELCSTNGDVWTHGRCYGEEELTEYLCAGWPGWIDGGI